MSQKIPETWAEQRQFEQKLRDESRKVFFTKLLSRHRSRADAAKAAGIERGTLRRDLVRLGLADIARGGIRPDLYADCAERGMSRSEAAEALGITVSKVSYAARRFGLKFRPAPRGTSDLAYLTESEREDYRLLRRKGGMSRDEAMQSIGRADLIGGAK